MMKKGTALLLVMILASGVHAQPMTYVWSQAPHGGGGYATGIQQDPVSPDIIYIRTDVGGMFRSDDGGKDWRAINCGMSKAYHHSVETFAISRQHPSTLFRGSGEARDHRMVGAIHKTTDGGRSWKLVTEKVDFFGNGDTRVYGEKMAVDPFDPAIVIALGNWRGIWRSSDEGESWQYVGWEKEPFGCIAFDGLRPSRVYAATLDSLPFADYLFPDKSYQRPRVGKLFISTDGGKTWGLLFEKRGVSFTNIVCAEDASTILATFRGDGIFKSTDGGRTFVKKTSALGMKDFSSICCDPGQSSKFYSAISRSPGQAIPIIPLYASEDGGESWNPIKDSYVWAEFRNIPVQYDRPETMGWAISKFLVDHRNPRKFYLCNWFGVLTSEDGCQSWDANEFRGIENTCLETVVASPTDPARAYIALADGQPCVSRDSGKSYRPLPYLDSPQNYYCSTVICPSRGKQGLIVYGLTNNSLRLSALCWSEDEGRSCHFSLHLTQGLVVQAIKEDPFEAGTFYAYIDGSLVDGAGLYRSTDGGKTWGKMPLELPPEIHRLPFRKEFIEGELLAVTAYQAKNACGTNQLLCVDPTRPNTIYFGEADKGIFATFDGGRTWENRGGNLPFGKSTAGVLNVIRADPKRPGWLYAGFIHEGLWRSRDFGRSWEKIYPAGAEIFNATSVAVGGPGGSEIFVACEPLFYSGAESAICASPDNGLSWSKISDPTLGAIRWKGIDVDETTGFLYAVSCGNGAFYGRPLGVR
ncbi:MAG TPA: hypothetical protein VL126_04445 [Bacteroidota bacterium]|nr:hypothetical protein [Bacteroidota bacterium]